MKKVLSIILCMSLCIMPVMSVSAKEASREHFVATEEYNASIHTSNYIMSSTIKLNAVNGSVSGKVSIPTGSVSGNPITSTTLNVRASNGSDPFKLYMQAPDGTLFWIVMDATGVTGVDSFNVENLSGRWTIWIETLGTASTATISAKVYYDYSY